VSPSLDRIQRLAPNEIEDHEYNNHQDDDANDPDTSKSSDHRSSLLGCRLPGREVAQSRRLAGGTHVLNAWPTGKAVEQERRHRTSEREEQSGDKEIGTCHICGRTFSTQEELSKQLMDEHAGERLPEGSGDSREASSA